MELCVIEHLGMGTMGSVDLVRLPGRNEAALLALKTIKKRGKNYDRKCVEREIEVARLISHPAIVVSKTSWEDEDNTYLLMDHIEGHDLFSFMEALDGPLPEPFARRLFDQLREIITYLHTIGVAHRDLKLDNLMIDDEGELKIIDFGLCKFNNVENCKGAVGSEEYCAPEIDHAGSCYNGFLADIWSMGVVLYALLFNSFPFSECSWNTLITHGEVDLSFPSCIPTSLAAQDLILKMLHPNPTQRISLQEMANHPWIKNT
eukprot:TRINITY_DN6571_c0_g1_i1.p1 TRINITY_DN6571_c0_g1~~TRINITY_DN6571_c0_g1_i1.p1  ORF type:complete len:261 (-),score=44.62 TRINITY_DN6571_c0_g1_i1:43-825(-)